MNKPAAPLVGQRIRRKEDLRFLTGEGRYIDDIRLPFMAHAMVLRSPHAHARIKSIRTKPAAAMPDVLAIYTASDLEAAKVGTLPVGWIVPATNGRPMAQPPHPVLARNRAPCRRSLSLYRRRDARRGRSRHAADRCHL